MLGLELTGRSTDPLIVRPGLERVGAQPRLDYGADAAITLLTSGTTGPPKRLPATWTVLAEMGDAGRARDAWQAVNPKRLGEHPHESELRQWYVAARVAAHLGDAASAAKILHAITSADPAFPGLDELEAAIGG